MSLIGPRPELVRYTNQYEGEEKDILKVRPGITDFSSVEFINLDEIVGGENADEMYEKYVLKKKNQLRMPVYDKPMIYYPLGISAVIELSQLILCRGWFEWDDMIHNMLGCVCGYLIVKRLYGLKCKFEDY